MSHRRSTKTNKTFILISLLTPSSTLHQRFTMDFENLVKEKKIVLVGKELWDGNIEVLVRVLQKDVVEELNLMCNRIALSNDKFTDALAQNSSLKVLNLYNNQVDGAGATRLAAALKVNTCLQQLFLEGNQLGDEG